MKKIAVDAGLLLILWGGALIAVVFFPLRLLTWKWKPAQAKEYARAIDQLNNAALFNGYARESLSSHAWRDSIWPVLRITEAAQPGHCKEANRHEQPVVDFINTYQVPPI